MDLFHGWLVASLIRWMVGVLVDWVEWLIGLLGGMVSSLKGRSID